MKILVAMSGGVDSSVTAALLHEQGHEVIGATMSLWENPQTGTAAEKNAKRCCGVEEVYGAKAVCDVIGVEHYTFDMREDFRKKVVDDFLAEYKAGRTPNPCVRCNQFLKFDVLLAKAELLGCEAIATGHYSVIHSDQGKAYLQKAADDKKDQSYFLYPILAKDLPKILFPLGEITKTQVRELAAKYKLPTAQKPESQDICFIPKSHVTFLEKHGTFSKESGDIVLPTGEVIGQHQGLHRYTIGQRKGIGIGYAKPLYVKEIDLSNNRLVVGDDSELFSTDFSVPDVNVLAPDLWDEGREYLVKVRYRSEPKVGVVRMENGLTRVSLREEERGITSGQSAVFYLGKTVVAGGIIHV